LLVSNVPRLCWNRGFEYVSAAAYLFLMCSVFAGSVVLSMCLQPSACFSCAASLLEALLY
jgi:hypothetical protein